MKRTPLKRKTALKQVSTKRKIINGKRRDFVKEQLGKRPHCEASSVIARAFQAAEFGSDMRPYAGWRCTLFATELHEPLTRARAPGAETILDPSNSVALCRNCHNTIHSHVAWAERLGLLRRSPMKGEG